jgi:flagellin
MKEKVLAATEAGLSTASKQALSDEYTSLRDQIDTIANNATFDGVNLISRPSVNSSSIKAIANADATATIDIDHVDLSKSNAKIAATLTSLTGAVGSADVKDVEDAIQDVSSALSKLGTGAKALDTHMTNVMKLQDTLDAGVGNLVDADLAKESAKLQALTRGGAQPITLPSGETRAFLQDGDELSIAGHARADGYVAIGFGPCTGMVVG